MKYNEQHSITWENKGKVSVSQYSSRFLHVKEIHLEIYLKGYYTVCGLLKYFIKKRTILGYSKKILLQSFWAVYST